MTNSQLILNVLVLCWMIKNCHLVTFYFIFRNPCKYSTHTIFLLMFVENCCVGLWDLHPLYTFTFVFVLFFRLVCFLSTVKSCLCNKHIYTCINPILLLGSDLLFVADRSVLSQRYCKMFWVVCYLPDDICCRLWHHASQRKLARSDLWPV